MRVEFEDENGVIFVEPVEQMRKIKSKQYPGLYDMTITTSYHTIFVRDCQSGTVDDNMYKYLYQNGFAHVNKDSDRVSIYSDAKANT